MTYSGLRIGTRHWDHVAALGTDDIGPYLDVDHQSLDTTPDLWQEPDLDVAETSFSRYVRARAAGDDRVTALPIFVMRGFRHRCILVCACSHRQDPAGLRGGRVGISGWPDSGNTWTRALLIDAGVALDEVQWQVGPLTTAHPTIDRMGGLNPGPHVSVLPAGDNLDAALHRGDLDAVMTPFMPPGFYTGSSLRTLYPDTQAVEQAYFSRNGFIPGMHLIGVRSELLDRAPDLAQELLDLFEAAKEISAARRNKLVDILPWHDRELARTIAVFGEDWMPYGWATDEAMVATFQEQLLAQHLLRGPVPVEDLFPFRLNPTRTAHQESYA